MKVREKVGIHKFQEPPLTSALRAAGWAKEEPRRYIRGTPKVLYSKATSLIHPGKDRKLDPELF